MYQQLIILLLVFVSPGLSIGQMLKSAPVDNEKENTSFFRQNFDEKDPGIRTLNLNEIIKTPDSHIIQKLSLSFEPFIVFGTVHPQTGFYHPVQFVHPLTIAGKVNYGIQYKHFITQVYFSTGKPMRFYLQFTENPDSSFSPVNKKNHADAIAGDTIGFYTVGLQFGRTGRLGNRFSYDALIGIRSDYIAKPVFQYNSYLFIPHSIDTINHVIYYSERFESADRMLYSHVLASLEITAKLNYAITKSLSIQASLSYNDSPASLLKLNKNDYVIKYNFYNLNGDMQVISTGEASTHFNQLHPGIGLSYQF